MLLTRVGPVTFLNEGPLAFESAGVLIQVLNAWSLRIRPYLIILLMKRSWPVGTGALGVLSFFEALKTNSPLQNGQVLRFLTFGGS